MVFCCPWLSVKKTAPSAGGALQEMNPPLARALNGEIGVREALRESQDKVNVLFAKRPKEWVL